MLVFLSQEKEGRKTKHFLGTALLGTPDVPVHTLPKVWRSLVVP